jgi:FtsP/CotA-like multicopper oxidase with cupredoxin domain
MSYRTFNKCFIALVLVPVCLTLLMTGMAIGAPPYFLKAGIKVIPAKTFNNPKAITMWGFARCDAAFANCSSVQVPGPTLTATAGQPLSITVMNNLNGRHQEPVSIIVPGLIKAMTPVWMDTVAKPFNPSAPAVATGSRPAPGNPADQNDPAYRYRVRSFDAEARLLGDTQTYTWAGGNVKEGTYLYQSGTHPSVQVQMGLYGPLVVYPAGGPGTAYGTAYNAESLLLFSEIDPALHDAIATGHYGPNPPIVNPQANWMTSMANYTPRYFLVNGNPYSPISPAIAAGSFGQTVLLRFLNAGLATKVPALQDTFNIIQTPPSNLPYMTILAEDGYPVPWLKQQYSLLLPAGKTMDAVISTTATLSTGAAGANIALYDRRLNLTNSPLIPGGQLTYLHVGSAPIVNVFPSAVNFGNVLLYNPTQTIVTIKNNGMQTLLVTNAAPVGPNAAEFQTNTSAALGAIAPGKSASITVYFTPTTKGAKSATLHIITSDANQPAIDIPLYAVGI